MNKLIQIRSYLLVTLSLCIFLMVSCGQVKTTSYFTPTKTKLSQFEAVQFDNFVTEIVDFPKEALVEVPTESATLLASKNKFKEVKHGVIENIPATDTIVVLGEVTEYRPSSDVSYEGGALKFGEVSVTVKLALVEKTTGNEITTGEINVFSSMGFLAKDINKSLADEIVKYILESY